MVAVPGALVADVVAAAEAEAVADPDTAEEDTLHEL